MVVVSDVVGDGCGLRLQTGPGLKFQIPFGLGLGHRPSGFKHRTIVLGQALERFPAEVEPVEVRIGRFEPGDDADGVRVMVEAAGVGERRIERILARMAERRMAEVMRKAQRFGEVLVEAQRASDGASDLRDFETVGEANAEMVAVGGDEHLGLVSQPPKGDRMDDPVAVTLEDVARAVRTGIAFRMETTPRAGRIRGERRSELHSVPTGTI